MTAATVCGASGGSAADSAAGGGAAAVKQKKRKQKFCPNPNKDPTLSQEEKDNNMDNFLTVIVQPPTPLIEGLRSPTEPFTYTELEDMHSKIVQK